MRRLDLQPVVGGDREFLMPGVGHVHLLHYMCDGHGTGVHGAWDGACILYCVACVGQCPVAGLHVHSEVDLVWLLLIG